MLSVIFLIINQIVKNKKHIGLHGICWMFFIGYELTVIHYTYGKLDPMSDYLLFYGINILYFYLHSALLNVSFSKRQTSYAKGFFLAMLLFIIFMVVKCTTDFLIAEKRGIVNQPTSYLRTQTPLLFFRGIYFMVLSTFYWASGHISFYRQQAAISERNQLVALNEKAELQTRVAELNSAYLQQQLNPHLLFNTLNFIYNSVYRYSEQGSRCVLLLADIMRFSLEKSDADGKVLLAGEVEQLKNLIEINRYRFNDQLFLLLEMDGDFDEHTIIPLILFTLTENVFKHGDLSDPSKPASLCLKTNSNGNLYYASRNKKKLKNEKLKTDTIGIRNIRLRLEFAYPGTHKLRISETDDSFDLTLHLQL